MADESKEGITYDGLAFLTKKLLIEGVFLQTYEFKFSKSNNEGPVSYLLYFNVMFANINFCSIFLKINFYYEYLFRI